MDLFIITFFCVAGITQSIVSSYPRREISSILDDACFESFLCTSVCLTAEP